MIKAFATYQNISYVHPGNCSYFGGKQITHFRSDTGDCYSQWGYRYNKGDSYYWSSSAEGKLWLRCYIT